MDKNEQTQNATSRSPSGRAKQGFDLERLYELYPRKRGKRRGMEIAKREVRTAADYARLEQSIRNYASECRGKEQRYIRYFDRFMVDWEDWVKPEASDTDEAGYDWERVFGRKS